MGSDDLNMSARRRLQVDLRTWSLKRPFRITGHVFSEVTVVVVGVSQGAASGRGEAAGVYFLGDTPEGLAAQIEGVRADIEAGATRQDLLALLPPGGARNALDCALWDLEAQLTGRTVAELAGVGSRPLLTTYTLGADTPEAMAAGAVVFAEARAIKLKLTGDPEDAARIRAVRAARPDVWLSVDANQGFTRDSLAALMPTMLETDVKLVEQPFPVGREADLDGLERPIPFAADETARSLGDIAGLVGRFDAVNIKLDKCGGLTEALMIARHARRLGLKVMVGNMSGTSLAMAPAFVVGQLCDIVDLDGPLLLSTDYEPAATYCDGLIDCTGVWGPSAALKDLK